MTETCNSCKGVGYVAIDSATRRPVGRPSARVCTICNGSGLIGRPSESFFCVKHGQEFQEATCDCQIGEDEFVRKEDEIDD